MGLFGKPRSSSDVMEEELRTLAPILFPGGHAEIQSAGHSISGLLDSRIPPEAAARLYASMKYLSHTAPDRSKPTIMEYILKQGMGRISEEDASAIYDRFIAPRAADIRPSPASASAEKEIRVNAELGDRSYRLSNSFQTGQISAALFVVIVTVLRDSGWRGGSTLFDQGGNVHQPLVGTHRISDNDARSLARLLAKIVQSTDMGADVNSAVEPLVRIAYQGAFTIEA